MKHILILLAHPHLEESKANVALMNAVQDLPHVRVMDLYKEPFAPDTYREAFAKADILVFQFPFYWGSAPSRLKQWLDEIFMAFFEDPGPQGKQLLVVTTTGSEQEAYRAGGRDQFTMDELLRPYQFTAIYSGMGYLTPLVVYSTAAPDADRYITEGAKAYRQYLLELQG